MIRTLLIDDDEKLATLLVDYCSRYNIEVTAYTLPSRALNRLAQTDAAGFDCIILDVMLPEMDGFEVLRHIRAQSGTQQDIPVIMLTARGEVTDRVVGLEIGADDYMPKPFDPRELVARISTIVKRRTRTASENSMDDSTSVGDLGLPLLFEDLLINRDLREVQLKNKRITLTTMEYQLLLLFAEAPGKDFSRDDILAELKGTETELFSRSVDILVSRLRSKLKPLTPIRTVHGHGYAWIPQPLKKKQTP